MGVDIGSILQKRETTLEALAGKRLAIDAFNTLYQFITIIRQPDGTPLMDSHGRITSHLSGLFYRTCSLMEKGIKPVYVFDGKPSDLKKRTLEERAAVKKHAELQRLEAIKEGDIERAGALAQRTAKLGSVEIEQSKQLLTIMGVPWVQAPGEGEAQCAAMAQQGIVDAAASQDYDTLLFGTPILVRNLTIAGKKKIPRRNMTMEVKPEEINLEESLQKLNITREKLIWIGLLNGTDFNEGIYGIGPKKALKLAQDTQHTNFDSILQEIGKEMQWKEVYDLFMHPNVVEVDKDTLKQREPPQREEIFKLMVEEHEFSKERVESSLKRAFKDPEDSNQSQLKKWF
ncbi:MAG: flap endonuclease-1 [Candidatus Micrarchaeota archaeon]